jgi:DNA invertase Pin-like site-specific DNA recombinase
MRIGEPCKYCLRPITQKVLAEKHQRKIQNALNTVAKMKAKGGKWSGGRPKVRDDEEIKRLRMTGLSLRDIAKRVGLSTTAVQRALK